MPRPNELRILPGMTAKVEINLAILTNSNNKNNFIVPSKAIITDTKNNSYIWILEPKNNTATKIKVSIGNISTKGIVITSGVNNGDLIITAGLNELKEGMKVKPLNKERGL